MEEEARPAGLDDVEAISYLARQAVTELRPQRGGDLWAAGGARAEPFDQVVRAELADPDRLVVVGTVDEAVVGYGTVRRDVLPDGRALAVVDDLYVDPGAREVGVGEAMMDLLVDWSTARGCVGIEATVLPGNRATKNFFETFGLTARAIVVHRALEP